MTFVPTDEQLAVKTAIEQESDSLLIEAYAGCAKSSTLEFAAQNIRFPVLSLQFNKKTALESAKRLPSNFSVKTMNGLGHGAWLRTLGNAKVEIDDRKVGKLITQVAKEFKTKLSSAEWSGVKDFVGQAMLMGIVPNGSGPEGLLPDSEDSWLAVGEAAGLDFEDIPSLIPLAHEVLVQDIALARQGMISFDDQIYCSTLLGGVFPKFPMVFVDESQDLSILNHQMLAKCSAGRIVAVGDSRQAIYAFRGADANSIENLQTLRPTWARSPLRTTFRCTELVVARQQSHAPGFRAWSGCKPGRYVPWHMQLDPSWSTNTLLALKPDASTLAILCRNNGPVISLAFKLIRRGIGVQVLGRDIGKNLIALSKKICPDDSALTEEFEVKLDTWTDHELGLAKANDQPQREASILDRAECLRAVLQSGEPHNAGAIRALLERLFQSESGLITLASIHKSKGLEWDVVMHLDPWRVPSKFALEAAKVGQMEQLEQEYNLMYVAETRTKDVLIEANLKDFI